MKKTVFSLLLVSAVGLSADQAPAMEQVNPMDQIVTRGEQLATDVYNDTEIRAAFGDLMEAHLTFLHVMFRAVAHRLTHEEKTVTQMALRMLVDVVTDPVVRELISRGGVDKISESEKAYIEAKLKPLEAFSAIAPAFEKLLEEKITVTTTEKYAGGTYPQTQVNPEYVASILLFTLDQVTRVLEDAQKAIQQ